MTVITPAFAVNTYRPTSTGDGNDISLSISGADIVAWHGIGYYYATASDTDYYATDGVHFTNTIADTITYSWDSGGMGNPGNPTGNYTGIGTMNAQAGIYTVKSIVNDGAPSVAPNGSRDDSGTKEASMQVAVVRTDIDTGLDDTG